MNLPPQNPDPAIPPAQPPQAPNAAPSPAQPPTTPGASGAAPNSALDLTFREYQFLSESTDKITDRRQTVNTLFVTVNALFLSGVGYLLLQLLNHLVNLGAYFAGFAVIAVIMTIINRAWLRLSDSNRKLVDLRMRYLEQLEKRLRDSGAFPSVEIALKKYEVRDGAPKTLTSRGTYTIEEVLYSVEARRQPFGFSRAERRFAITLTFAYWVALLFAIVAYLLMSYLPASGMALPHP